MITATYIAFKKVKVRQTKIVLFGTHSVYHSVMSYSKLLLNWIYMHSLLMISLTACEFPVTYYAGAFVHMNV